MHPYLAEFLGTALLILFGNGVVANVVLAGTNGHKMGWIVITAGWGIAVFIGAACSAAHSGAHLNPAVTLAMALANELDWESVPGFMASQMAGAMVGGGLVFLFYRQHFLVTEDVDAKLSCFCTRPAIRNFPQAFFCEVVGTFALIMPIFLMAAPEISLPTALGEASSAESPVEAPGLGLGAIGLLPVGLLVFGIGLSLGGTTGYAINPARDLGPRLMHFLLPIPGKRDSDWSYSWVPVLGPLTGATLAAVLYMTLIK